MTFRAGPPNLVGYLWRSRLSARAITGFREVEVVPRAHWFQAALDVQGDEPEVSPPRVTLFARKYQVPSLSLVYGGSNSAITRI
jgi:hypothetical protein